MSHKKNRELVFGVNSVTSYLEVSPERILQAFVLKGREDDKRIAPLLNRLYDNGLSVQLCQKRFLDEKTEGSVHQGIVLEVRPYEIADEHDLEALLDGQPKDREWLFLVLDGVTDPHNIGAALRSAWARSFCRSVSSGLGEGSGWRRDSSSSWGRRRKRRRWSKAVLRHTAVSQVAGVAFSGS